MANMMELDFSNSELSNRGSFQGPFQIEILNMFTTKNLTSQTCNASDSTQKFVVTDHE